MMFVYWLNYISLPKGYRSLKKRCIKSDSAKQRK